MTTNSHRSLTQSFHQSEAGIDAKGNRLHTVSVPFLTIERYSNIVKHFDLYIHLELESSHPDHHGISCEAKQDGEGVEDDADIVHDGLKVHFCRVIL